jgi:rhamnose utilization protein RhaD (predicted bifunctional aldolase and dehydrogenase)
VLEDNIPPKSSEAAAGSAKAIGSVPNRWDDSDAAACLDDLALRAYSSRLIGQDPRLVLRGGGNTSVKSAYTDCFGNVQDAIWVNASVFDLGQMGIEGFTGLLLKPLLKLASAQ